jgi:hypothetical protein
MANARPDDGRPRLDVGHRPAPIAGRDGDRRAAGAAARGDLDVASSGTGGLRPAPRRQDKYETALQRLTSRASTAEFLIERV